MTVRTVLWPAAMLLSTFGFIVVHSVCLTALYTTIKDKALYGYAFRNLTKITVAECAMLCLQERFCMAFQMSSGNTKCQLLSSNHFLTPSAMITTKGCSYHDRIQVKNLNNDRLHNPCYNNGSYVPLKVTDSKTPRFKCNCLPGYAGDLCQDVVKSCRGYMNGTRRAGRYKVFDDKMKLYEVFCDFDSDSSTAWTLIQSYQRQRVHDFREAFIVDSPINDDSPRWDAYRLPLMDRMQSIQSDSSKFRFTCKYDTDGVVYRDYLEATKTQVDILSFVSLDSPCHEIENLNIRGQDCTSCTVLLYQVKNRFPLHSDSSPNNLQKHGCEFQPSGGLQCSSTNGEDNFGAYNCINEEHRCTSSPTATTQAWLGGN